MGKLHHQQHTKVKPHTSKKKVDFCFFFFFYFKKCINVHRCPNMGQGSTSVKCQGLVVAISCSSTLEMLNTRKNSAS